MNWYNDEGHLLIGEAATVDNTESFSLDVLTDEDVVGLPLREDIVIEQAMGVVALANIGCSWQSLESYMVRADQDVVSEDWEGYQRSFLSSRSDFENATLSDDYARINEAIDPFDAEFDPAEFGSSVLMTDNIANPGPILFTDLPAYGVRLHLRHGVFTIDDGETGAVVALSFTSDPVYDDNGSSGLLQSYSVEVIIDQGSGQSLRLLALWNDSFGPGVESDSAIVLNYAVNRALDSADHLSDLCAGMIDIPDE